MFITYIFTIASVILHHSFKFYIIFILYYILAT
nr:MAG TPA: hypothetical protein [Caudoviricetes sp.]